MNYIRKNLFNVLSILIAAIGLISSLFAAKTQVSQYFYLLVLTAVVELILLIISLCFLIEKQRFDKTVEEKDATIHRLEENAFAKEEEIEVLRNDYLEQKQAITHNYLSLSSQMVSFLKEASKMNNDFCNRIPTETKKAYDLLDTLNKETVSASEAHDLVLRSHREFASALFELYKRYTTSFLPAIVGVVESFIKMRGYNHEVSATVKLFNRPIMSPSENRDDLVVYSAFRDKRTYSSDNNREIGEIPYTVDGNIDFFICLSKEQFIINNAKKGSENYTNEHVDFDVYYNCAVVVPIRVKQNSGYKYLGYICCDCLNSEDNKETYKPNAEIFTKEVAHLIFSLAQNYGMFLETLDSNWIDKMQDIEGVPLSFLSLVFDKTFKGNR